jgi:hypothetical protein
VEELDAYVEGYQRELAQMGNYAGLSKISVQTGTSHGGIMLADGTMASVAVDFDTLRDLGERARHHGSGGAVQHGASTLPEEFFNKFPEVQTLEIHLATGFQNLFMDHPSFPSDLKQSIYSFLNRANADERKPSMSDAQFYYSTRKKAMGPFKAELWSLESESRSALAEALEEKFSFFYEKLNIDGTRELVDELVTPVEFHQPIPKLARAAGDDLGLAD